MLKKSLLTVIFTCLFSLLLFLGYRIIEKLADKKEAKAKIQTLPAVHLFTMDSAAFQVPVLSYIALLYFNSGCEHCQYELKEFKKKPFIICQDSCGADVLRKYFNHKKNI